VNSPSVTQARYPLSLHQKGIWFFHRLSPDNPFYNVSIAYPLTGPVDEDCLRRSIEEIVRRHEVLRCRFEEEAGEGVQIVGNEPEFGFRVVDLRDLPPSQREAEAKRLALEEARHGFDIAVGPLLRTILIQTGDEERLLVFNVDHIAFDAWSQGAFLGELAEIYPALLAGEEVRLDEPDVQYSDFVYWQQDWLQGEVLSGQMDFWREKLAGAEPVLELPLDKPRPPVFSYRGAAEVVPVPQELTENFRALCRREGVTLFMGMLAVWQVLLKRYTSRDDVLVGCPVSGRVLPELEKSIGMFVNMMVVRTDLSGAPSFREVLGRVRDQVLEAHDHQYLPIENLMEALQPERNASYNPIYQVVLTMREMTGARQMGPVTVHPPLDLDTGTSKLDLTLSIDQHPDRSLGTYLEYNTDLFEPATAKRILGHFHALLAEFIRDPEQSIDTAQLLTRAEQRSILVDWNATGGTKPQAASFQQHFEAVAAERGDAPAVTALGETLSYRELNERANQIAHELLAAGVEPDSLVGICCERDVTMVAAILGIWKAGGCYVPLDTAFPEERLAFMLEDVAPQVVVACRTQVDKLPETTAKLVYIDDPEAELWTRPKTNPEPRNAPEHRAYVVYTSGSTGQPKGVPVPHRALVNLTLAMQETPGIGPEDVFLMLATYSWDSGVGETWIPIAAGAHLVICSREDATDAMALKRVMEESGLTILMAGPTTWAMLLGIGWKPDAPLRILCGGEPLPSNVLREMLEHPHNELWNMYGPTENTIWSSGAHLTDPDRTISLGRPLPNTQSYVLDDQLNPVPDGIPGELVLGGVQVACGYLNREELTAERFVDDPFRDEPGAKLYRTGDIVKRHADGTLEYVGRNDFQVKIRGHRVELGEVEARLEAHPAVHVAVAIAREDTPGDKRLVAYMTLVEGGQVSKEELGSWCLEELPRFMLPSAFVVLDELPKNPNGKIDRKRLPAPDDHQLSAGGAKEAARNEVEALLIEVWEDVLKTKPIGVHDDFFELGGHSLLAVKLVNRVQDVFGQTLDLTSLISSPTVAQQAEILNQGVGTGTSRSLVKIQAEGTRTPIFCVCSLGGTVLNQRTLARLLGDDQPFYGLQAVNLHETLEHPPRIADYAAHYVGVMKEVQPDGPYVVGGHSFGAMVAFEIAQQLVAGGDEVRMLFTLDSALPTSFVPTFADKCGAVLAFLRGLPYAPAELLQRLRNDPTQLRKDLAKRLSFMGKLFGSRFKSTTRAEDVAAGRVQAAGKDGPRFVPRFDASEVHPDFANIGPEDYIDMSYWPDHNKEIAFRHFDAMTVYRPEPFAGPVTLFRCRRQPFLQGRGLKMGWDRLATSVNLYNVPGGHMTLLAPPNVQVLAEKLRDALDDRT
jgi:amino acid adenylation domain-containing protein